MTTEAAAPAAPAEAPVTKKQKVEETAGEGASAADTEMKEPAAEPKKAAVAVAGGKKLGYKTFKDGMEAWHYFHHLLQTLTKHQNVNKYEHQNLLALVSEGHSDPQSKIGSGVEAFQVRPWEEDPSSSCFYVIRTDGTAMDFSYRKCLINLFPGTSFPLNKKKDKSGGRGGGRSPGRGGRGRGRGRK